MSYLTDSLMANTRITSISKPNRIKSAMKLENGNLQVTQHSGNVFEIDKDEKEMQAFAIYSVLAEL